MKNIALRQLIKYKMKTLRESAQQALEALHLPSMKTQAMLLQRDEAITVLREALAQPELEDVVAYHADGTRTVRISAQPPSEWVLVKKILDEYGLDAIAFVAEWKAAQPEQEQEPVAYYHPHKGFYWAKPTSISSPTVVDVSPVPLYVKWKAAQRPWQGLTDDEIEETFVKPTMRKIYQAIEAALKEKNT